MKVIPVSRRRVRLDRLPDHYREAVDSASDLLDVPGDWRVKVERFRTADVRHVIEEVWGWPCSLNRLRGEDRAEDRERVRTIIKLQKSGEPVWPYVSYWASDFAELAQVVEEDDGVSVPNHGDGWHRIIAAVEQKRRHVEIVFI